MTTFALENISVSPKNLVGRLSRRRQRTDMMTDISLDMSVTSREARLRE